jgi:polysaccharide export outer membrane protein
LGEISKPSTVDLTETPLSLTQALSRQGGLDDLRADARGVFVFREIDGKTTVFQLDTSNPEGYLIGTRFALRPMDVIYVTRAPIQRWNDAISRFLPSVNATRAVRNL